MTAAVAPATGRMTADPELLALQSTLLAEFLFGSGIPKTLLHAAVLARQLLVSGGSGVCREAAKTIGRWFGKPREWGKQLVGRMVKAGYYVESRQLYRRSGAKSTVLRQVHADIIALFRVWRAAQKEGAGVATTPAPNPSDAAAQSPKPEGGAGVATTPQGNNQESPSPHSEKPESFLEGEAIPKNDDDVLGASAPLAASTIEPTSEPQQPAPPPAKGSATTEPRPPRPIIDPEARDAAIGEKKREAWAHGIEAYLGALSTRERTDLQLPIDKLCELSEMLDLARRTPRAQTPKHVTVALDQLDLAYRKARADGWRPPRAVNRMIRSVGGAIGDSIEAVLMRAGAFHGGGKRR